MKNLATKFENLTIQNDFIFKKVMSRKRICIHLLEELLQIKIADINYIEAEKSLEPDYTSRGIRLDIITIVNQLPWGRHGSLGYRERHPERVTCHVDLLPDRHAI